jgi:hypothetical protein
MNEFSNVDLSQKNPFYSILPEATLLSSVEEFASGTHRGKNKKTKIFFS